MTQDNSQVRVPTLREAQRRLIVWGQKLPRFGADGLGGAETYAAILAFQKSHWPPLKETGQFDKETVAALFRDPPSAVHTLTEDLAIGAISLTVNSFLKGTGIQMDFAKISKAIAGGISGAIATTGTMAAVYFQLPPEAQTHFPGFVYSVLPWVNEAFGFVIGFSVVYFAPANKG